MVLRDIMEVEVRQLLEDAEGLRPDRIQGRWIVESQIAGRRWEIILEPDMEHSELVIVSAFRILP